MFCSARIARNIYNKTRNEENEGKFKENSAKRVAIFTHLNMKNKNIEAYFFKEQVLLYVAPMVLCLNQFSSFTNESIKNVQYLVLIKIF